ncbi:uncharacterized protein N0V89_012411 [Didymosphaeria variabile]|uniref:beta-N-acetylhexosaminidase n=1 Tax=Didymosphaeria variabile TaxID=1932322 RepID=A0A9W9C510_9PLEO|nr:uncharacterized protein N0V89_012411 [Didymosphaeria variabile]KAJ4344667.1 hypothetical protein N0V89_012411 [Didymosphaeria variabile]
MHGLIRFGSSLLLASVSARGIPTTAFAGRDGKLSLSGINSIIVDSQYAESTNTKGETLIPPSLQDFAETFAKDLSGLHINVSCYTGTNASDGSIFLTIGNSKDYLDVAGRESAEGYSLSVSDEGIKIVGASSLGAWWGTRTVLQQVILGNGSIPYGSLTDTPEWGTRGMMLDAARHWYPADFLIEMCAYMSFFKQNTFQVHLSDNLYNNVDIYSRERSLDLYARFRLWSDDEAVAGLNEHKNESYTREQFDEIQSACAARGVTILPEIEAPGHALPFVQWKPELGLEDDLSLLNISHPETIPTMKTIWSTFLPWFHTKTVHIGADEYTAEVNDYNIFVNSMADHIQSEANKSIRIWGTFPPNYTDPGYINIYNNVSVQHWEFFEDNPLYDYILNNYTVLNSDDTFYVVNKWSGSYPPQVNVSATFIGNPNTGGGLWYPYVFDARNSSNNPSRDEPLVLGEIAPLWNDYGPNATVYSETFYAWRRGIPALADKQWGGNLSAAEFDPVLELLRNFIPGQNLERTIPSVSSSILDYSFDAGYATSSAISDESGNGYDGASDCSRTEKGSLLVDTCTLTTPLASKGREYTLALSLLLSSLDSPENATLLSGRDSTLMLTPNITLFQGGNYYRLNSSLPMNQRVDLNIIGRGNQTFAKVNNQTEEEFLTKMGINGARFEWGPIAIEAPVHQIGGDNAGWSGELFALKLKSVA